MIYFWFPAYQVDSQDIDISQVEVPWDDIEPDVTTLRTKIKVRSPEFITDLAKTYEIITRKSMNNTIRTYVVANKRNNDLRTCSLRFTNLRNDRRLALEHFIQCAEGQFVGYKDPYGVCHVLLLLTADVTFTQEGRAGGGITLDKKPLEDEHATVDITAIFIRTYPDVTIDG